MPYLFGLKICIPGLELAFLNKLVETNRTRISNKGILVSVNLLV